MKPFNLEEALKGSPVKLRNGAKAYVVCDVRDKFKIVDADENLVLIGVKGDLKNDKRYFDALSWTSQGEYHVHYKDDNSIAGMWEEPELTQEQILEKAYNENLKVMYDKALFTNGYNVIAKTKDGKYILQNESYLTQTREDMTNFRIYEEKPSTVTVTLPRPFKPKERERYWRITTNELGNPCVREYEALSNKEARYGFKTNEDAQAWLDAMKEAADE